MRWAHSARSAAVGSRAAIFARLRVPVCSLVVLFPCWVSKNSGRGGPARTATQEETEESSRAGLSGGLPNRQAPTLRCCCLQRR
jgi:hypothetical protein